MKDYADIVDEMVANRRKVSKNKQIANDEAKEKLRLEHVANLGVLTTVLKQLKKTHSSELYIFHDNCWNSQNPQITASNSHLEHRTLIIRCEMSTIRLRFRGLEPFFEGSPENAVPVLLDIVADMIL